MNDIDRKQRPLQIVSRDTAVEEILQIMERRNVTAGISKPPTYLDRSLGLTG